MAQGGGLSIVAGMVRGTEGYREEAAALVERYDAIAFEDKHAAVLSLIPEAPCEAIDIGAATG
ncbi:MAG TPA: hypothetical protein VEA38_07755, partial [Terriglobales bacterium]|nr:hypothetical protein [Terriglobales bacterium]